MEQTTEISPEKLNYLVLKDIRGEISEEELDQLYLIPDEWRAELLHVVRGIDTQLSQRRAASIANGSLSVRKEYEKWRIEAVAFKTAAVARLTEAKRALKDKNREENYASGSNYGTTLLQILDEVRSIRTTLEGLRVK